MLKQHLQGMKKNEGEGLIFDSRSFLLHTDEDPIIVERLIGEAPVCLKIVANVHPFL